MIDNICVCVYARYYKAALMVVNPSSEEYLSRFFVGKQVLNEFADFQTIGINALILLAIPISVSIKMIKI